MKRACPSCPDGYVWDRNGPTAKTCPTCHGTAQLGEDDDMDESMRDDLIERLHSRSLAFGAPAEYEEALMEIERLRAELAHRRRTGRAGTTAVGMSLLAHEKYAYALAQIDEAAARDSSLGRMNDVPCDGCTRCCHNDAVRLLPGDDPNQYQTEPHPYVMGALMIAHAENGDCVYLGPQGCMIHATKPLMCREMDCRRIAQAITWTKARKLEAQIGFRMDVWRRGKELLRINGQAPNAEVSRECSESA